MAANDGDTQILDTVLWPLAIVLLTRGRDDTPFTTLGDRLGRSH
jgi:hypothetical protein